MKQEAQTERLREPSASEALPHCGMQECGAGAFKGRHYVA